LILTCKTSWMNQMHVKKMTKAGGSTSSVFLGCDWRCRWFEMSGFLGVLNSKWHKRQNGKTKAKVSAGWRRNKKVLVRGAKGKNRLLMIIMWVERYWGEFCRWFICYGGLKRILLLTVDSESQALTSEPSKWFNNINAYQWNLYMIY